MNGASVPRTEKQQGDQPDQILPTKLGSTYFHTPQKGIDAPHQTTTSNASTSKTLLSAFSSHIKSAQAINPLIIKHQNNVLYTP